SIHASSPHSVALMQLRFTSFAVVSLRRDFHPQDCAHAGRTKKRRLLVQSPQKKVLVIQVGSLALPPSGICRSAPNENETQVEM
ncbi:hypothetical protein, partial [Pseudomonas sp. GL-B-12]|uniref:hypothetical protein n=1 Tax=Pseudomonas sp. GL-B-12 TaxID=2832374 RepID=UPI001CC0725E